MFQLSSAEVEFAKRARLILLWPIQFPRQSPCMLYQGLVPRNTFLGRTYLWKNEPETPNYVRDLRNHLNGWTNNHKGFSKHEGLGQHPRRRVRTGQGAGARFKMNLNRLRLWMLVIPQDLTLWPWRSLWIWCFIILVSSGKLWNVNCFKAFPPATPRRQSEAVWGKWYITFSLLHLTKIFFTSECDFKTF